jgi:membrane associated rhomboid family serine protease
VVSLIPISDANPTRGFPVVTVALIVANIAAFFFLQPGFGTTPEATRYFFDNVAIPCQLQDDCATEEQEAIEEFGVENVPPSEIIPERSILSFIGAVLFSTFLHGGFLHIGGNMLFLWVFGNNIEDFLGKVKFLLFYLAAGIVAGFAHVLTNIEGIPALLPAVGASGAVAGVMGAYLVLHPKARVNTLVALFFIWTVVQFSAWIVLGLWFVFQFFTSPDAGVAWMAHVGGFVFGAIAIFILGGRPQHDHHALHYEKIPRF